MNARYRIVLFLATLPSFACSEMTLEEKVGQCLMVHFNGKEVNSDARTLIQTVHAGGFIYYNWANGLDNPDQVRSLSRGLQQMASAVNFNIITIEPKKIRYLNLRQGFRNVTWTQE